MTTAFARSCSGVAIAATFTACGGASGGIPDRFAVDTLRDGTVLVSNPAPGAWTEATAWRVTEDLRIGATDGDGPDVFAAPAALEVDGDGRIFVADQIAREVRVFDARGRHVRSFGGQGQGPGEMERPVALSWGRPGELWVLDPDNARFTVFDTAGAFRRTHIRFNGFMMEPWPGRVDRSGRVYDVGMVEEGRDRVPALVRFEPSLEEADTFRLPFHRPETFETRQGSSVHYTANVPFTPQMVWALAPDGLVWSGTSDRYRIRVHRPGGDTLRVVETAHEPVTVAREELDSLPGQLEWFTRQGGRIDLSRVPRTKPAFVSIQVDDRGYAWVRPSTAAAERTVALDVFEPEGRYLGRLSLPLDPAKLRTLLVRGDHVYAVVESDLGVPQVVRFRVEGRDRPAARGRGGA